VEGDVGCLLSRLCTEAVEVLGCSGARVMLVDDPADGSCASQAAAVSVPDDVPPAWAVPLRVGEQTMGTLDHYDCGSSAPSPDGVLAAQTLADVAGGLTWQMRSQEQDRLLSGSSSAPDSRVVIEQATGWDEWHADPPAGSPRAMERERLLGLLADIAGPYSR
jgi:hypothetical protein